MTFRVQILDGAVDISHSANTLRKGTKLITLQPVIWIYSWADGSLNLDMATFLEDKKKTKLRVKTLLNYD